MTVFEVVGGVQKTGQACEGGRDGSRDGALGWRSGRQINEYQTLHVLCKLKVCPNLPDLIVSVTHLPCHRFYREAFQSHGKLSLIPVMGLKVRRCFVINGALALYFQLSCMADCL